MVSHAELTVLPCSLRSLHLPRALPSDSRCLQGSRAGGQPYLRTAARFWALMLSHHLEKKEISDQMKRRRGSSCIFSTMLLRMCCVWS